MWAHDLEPRRPRPPRADRLPRRSPRRGSRTCTCTTTTTPNGHRWCGLSMSTASTETTLDELIETGMFVDLYPIVRNRCRSVPRATSLKHRARSPATSAVTRSTRVPARSSSTRRGWPIASADRLDRDRRLQRRRRPGHPGLRDWLVEQRAERARGAPRCQTSTSPTRGRRRAGRAAPRGSPAPRSGSADRAPALATGGGRQARWRAQGCRSCDGDGGRAAGQSDRCDHPARSRGRKPQHHARTGKQLKRGRPPCSLFPPQEHRRRGASRARHDVVDVSHRRVTESSSRSARSIAVARARCVSTGARSAARHRGHRVVARQRREVRPEKPKPSGAPKQLRRRDGRRHASRVRRRSGALLRRESLRSLSRRGTDGGRFAPTWSRTSVAWAPHLDGSSSPSRGRPGPATTYAALARRSTARRPRSQGRRDRDERSRDRQPLTEAVRRRSARGRRTSPAQAMRTSNRASAIHVEHLPTTTARRWPKRRLRPAGRHAVDVSPERRGVTTRSTCWSSTRPVRWASPTRWRRRVPPAM